ncbi:MAG: DUF4132 domain-containing protein [Raineya sp.]|jgi:hypothetical protein|nr:DUF4132 domain-containing protein [Raineya sp.]
MALSPEKVQIYVNAIKASNYPEGIKNPETVAGQKLAEIEEYLLGKIETVPVLGDYMWSYLRNICKIFNLPNQWGADDERIFKLFLTHDVWIPKSINAGWFAGQGSREFFSWLNEYYHKNKDEEKSLMLWLKDLFKRHKVSEEEVLFFIAKEGDSDFELIKETSEYNKEKGYYDTTYHGLSLAGLYVLSFIPEKVKEIAKIALKESREEDFFELLARADKNFLEKYGELFLDKYDDISKNVSILVKINAEMYEPFILKILPKAKDTIADKCLFYLGYHMPKKYARQLIENSYQFFEKYGFRNHYSEFAEERVQFLLNYDYPTSLEFLTKQFSETYLTFAGGWYTGHVGWVIETLEKKLHDKCIPMVAEFFKNKDILICDIHFYKILFNTLEKYKALEIYEKELWTLTKHKSKQVRQVLASFLAKFGEEAISNAQELLEAKNADARQTGAFVLARIKTPKAEKILEEALNNEKNDDTRDIMVEALGEKFYQKLSKEKIKEIVLAAEKRGKLSEPLTTWLNESKLPKIVFIENLGIDEKILTRFVLYRLSRAKEIRSEVEARLILPFIDKKSSAEFAKSIFKAFIENGSDAKQKYCLTIAGFLGDDNLVDIVKPQITKWVDASRGKMAEYAVVTLALVGSNKALRAVEFFSRKYKNKYSNIGVAALNALQVAAEELNMDINELADSIIPDFGFENMYKTFQVNNEEYRAFINKDFKLAFLNEDGKIIKSAPKTTSKEVLEEFKEIGKEIRDVVKAQSSRMELYLVIQRKWQQSKWHQFFLTNPIMFMYATRIVWGIFDEKGALKQSFYCNEDTTILNLEDDEINLPENAEIGMVHPLFLSETEKNAWIEKFYELGIEPVFLQMQRPVVYLEESLKNKNIVEEFDGKKGDPTAVKSLFRRFGWVAYDIEDHGDISSFAKTFETFGIRAIINTGGGLYLGYDGGWDAEFGTLGFYLFDAKWDDKGINLGKVPDVVYSEVMSELRQIVPKPEENTDNKGKNNH